jgi:hypothetical protein
MDDSIEEDMVTAPTILQQPSPPASDSQPTGSIQLQDRRQSDVKQMDIDEEAVATDMLSPISAEGDKPAEGDLPGLSSTDLGAPTMGYDFSNMRVCKLNQGVH